MFRWPIVRSRVGQGDWFALLAVLIVKSCNYTGGPQKCWILLRTIGSLIIECLVSKWQLKHFFKMLTFHWGSSVAACFKLLCPRGLALCSFAIWMSKLNAEPLFAINVVASFYFVQFVVVGNNCAIVHDGARNIFTDRALDRGMWPSLTFSLSFSFSILLPLIDSLIVK